MHFSLSCKICRKKGGTKTSVLQTTSFLLTLARDSEFHFSWTFDGVPPFHITRQAVKLIYGWNVWRIYPCEYKCSIGCHESVSCFRQSYTTTSSTILWRPAVELTITVIVFRAWYDHSSSNGNIDFQRRSIFRFRETADHYKSKMLYELLRSNFYINKWRLEISWKELVDNLWKEFVYSALSHYSYSII